MKVTMADIARRVGVDTSTVSLALRNSPKVSVSMREKVRVAADEMGYRVNPYVSALMASRRSGKDLSMPPVIAMITSGQEPDSWKSSYNPKRFVEGIEMAGAELGIRIEHFWIGKETMTAKRMNEILCARGIKGAVLLRFGCWREKLKISWADLSTISYGICEGVPTSDWVMANHFRNMETILDHLKEQQYGRIGYAMETPYAYNNINPWLAIYIMEQYNHPEQDKIPPWVDEKPDFEGFRKWFEVNSPDVVICARPAKVIEWLGQMGLKIPEDVGVATIGMAETGGSYSGIVEKSHSAGQFALKMLFERIHRNEFGSLDSPHLITISGKWNQGDTLRPLTKSN